jgi:hypothetical protein
MGDGIEVFDGDEGLDRALYERLAKDGEEVLSCASAEGWGHHSGAVITRLDGKLYVTSGSGCSCGGSADIDGPFDDLDAAIGAVGQYADDLRRARDAKGAD